MECLMTVPYRTNQELLEENFILRQRNEELDHSASDRKRAEEALRGDELLWRLSIDNMIEAYALHEAIFDENGRMVDYRFLEFNPAAQKISNIAREEIVGRTAMELYPHIVERGLMDRYADVMATGIPAVIEDFYYAGDSLDKAFDISCFRIDGRHFACVFNDITERKRAEEERVKLQDQLFQSQKMESVGRLAGGVAHDFNNMLGVILGHVELAMDQVDPFQPLHADLREIHIASERSADLTRQLLAFARKQTVSPQVLDINGTVAGMVKMLLRIIGEDIHLSWLPFADAWPVKVDPLQIDQILANLCVNARDAIAGVGKITIETGNMTFDEAYCADHAGFVPGEYVLLAVSDNGCGMDKEIFGKLFEPFFTTKEPGKGTGLGLATVYGIVKQSNGFVNVYSEPDQGTTFKIYLPRHIGKADQGRTEILPESVSMGQETVMVVEDEPAILNLSKRILQKQGYQVLVAGTPDEAIRLAEERIGEIHLLMTDIIMPEMNGRELAKRILSLRPNLKRLFMSGYTADVIAHHGVLDEGVYFIQKPFSRKDLAAKVREALDSESDLDKK